MNERLKELFSKFKKGKALLIIGILGIALIGISSFLPSDRAEQKKGQTLDTEKYLSNLEHKVKKTVCAITGNNQVSVAITLENSVEYSYADEIKSDFTEKTQGSSTDKTDKNETQYITVKLADGSESALLVTEYMPEVRGVTVVCTGVNNGEDIENALMAMLGVSSRRICVIIK